MNAIQTQFVKPKLAGKSSTGLLQRKCSCGKHTTAGGDCASCRKKKLQRKTAQPRTPEVAPPIVHEVLRSPGRPLDAATRAFMEPRLGQDFSNVRIHTDGRAAESARQVSALAYTVGHDIVFGAGQFKPRSQAGRQLIAHELFHTLQQRRVGDSTESVEIESPDSKSEVDATRAAKCATSPSIPDRTVKPSPQNLMLQRATDSSVLPELPAQELSPPGNCSEEAYTRLANGVRAACKGPDSQRRCSESMSIQEIDANIAKFIACYAARVKLNSACFGGGDQGHRDQAQQQVNGVKNCQEVRRRVVDNSPADERLTEAQRINLLVAAGIALAIAAVVVGATLSPVAAFIGLIIGLFSAGAAFASNSNS